MKNVRFIIVSLVLILLLAGCASQNLHYHEIGQPQHTEQFYKAFAVCKDAASGVAMTTSQDPSNHFYYYDAKANTIEALHTCMKDHGFILENDPFN